MIQRRESRGGEAVLIVQQLDAIRRLCRRVLEAEGYRVFEAAGAAEALRVAEEIPGGPDLAILDVPLRWRSGFELADALEREYPALRTCFTGSYRWGEELRGRPFLGKPFSTLRLAMAAREALSEDRP